MHNWIAQMMALVVASVVILIIANVSIRVQRSSIATTQYRASKVNQVDLAGLMDRDLRNIGATYPNYVLDPADAIISFTSDTSGGIFTFWSQTERGMPPDSVRYEWTQTGTVRIDTVYVPAYAVTRVVNGDLTGGAAGAVTAFNLRLLNADGNVAGILSDTRQIEVNLSIISSLGSSELVETNDWQTVIRPAALIR